MPSRRGGTTVEDSHWGSWDWGRWHGGSWWDASDWRNESDRKDQRRDEKLWRDGSVPATSRGKNSWATEPTNINKSASGRARAPVAQEPARGDGLAAVRPGASASQADSKTANGSPTLEEAEFIQGEHRDDRDAFRKLHDAALRRFLLEEPQPAFDDDDVSDVVDDATQMLVDHDIGDTLIDLDIAEFDLATGGVTCKLCSMALNSKAQWADHQKGKKHFKKRSAEEKKERDRLNKLNMTKLPAESYQ